MINLLGRQAKREIRAARLNVKLRRYNILFGFTALMILLMFAGGYGFAKYEQQQYERQISDIENQLKKLNGTKKAAEDFTSNLTLAKDILSDEITYSSLIIEIANTIPAGSALDELTLENPIESQATTPGQETTGLNFSTKSYNDALQLKDALEASDLFENVRLAQTASKELGPTSSQYDRDFPFVALVQVTVSEQQP